MHTTRSRRTAAPIGSHHQSGLVGRLNAEWAELLGTPASRAAVRAWRGREPKLAGLRDLAAIEAAVRGDPVPVSGDAVSGDSVPGSTRADADELLLALLRQASSPTAPWTQLARRTVLQLMLPKAVAIARSQRGRIPDPDERISEVVACLYETIRGYPVDRRRRSVAGNLGLDTLHLLQRRTGGAPAELPCDPADPALDPTHGDPDTNYQADSLGALLSTLQRGLDLRVIDAADDALVARTLDRPAPLGGRGRLIELLVWAVEGRVLTAGDAALLASAYSAEPVDDRTLARRLGCERSTICKRRLRAIGRLRAAATGFLADAAA